jgi:NitT/TauT family transport system permease protein
MTAAIRKAAFYVVLFLAWQLLFSLRIWPDYLLPSPAQVARTLLHGIASSEYLLAIYASMKRLLAGYFISLALGLLLGLALAKWKIVEETVGSFVLGLQTLPSICWMPLALLWFGLSDAAIVFVVVMGSVLSIALATRTAVSHIPPLWIRAARTMGLGGWRLQLRVVLPAALPALVEGMKQGWSFAWRSLMGGELLFVTFGLGHLMNMGRELNDMSQVIGVMIVITVLGIATERLFFGILERRLAIIWGFQRA